jgi:molybdopterin biosynthesis enzyme MoaB
MRTDIPQAHSYKFTFRFQEKQKQILVVCHTDATRDEIEDRAGEAFEDWMEELNQEEHKRAPSKKEKKEIGKALNEFLLSAKRRRESSNGRLHYLGSN